MGTTSSSSQVQEGGDAPIGETPKGEIAAGATTDENIPETTVIEIPEDPLDPTTDKFGVCNSDRSWTCIFLSVLFFSVIAGLIIALVVTRTGIYEYYRPSPFVPPPTMYSVSYLIKGARFDFYEKSETLTIAREICRLRNSTLLYLKSDEEDAELDCYLNSRNMAEHRSLHVWLNETVLYGGPRPFFSHSVRYGSYIMPTDGSIIHPHNISSVYQTYFVKRGCDIAQNYSKQVQEQFNRDQASENVTVYNLVKIFGNNGLRARVRGRPDKQGCWDLIRSNDVPTLKHAVICRAEVNEANYTEAITRDPVLATNPGIPFSAHFCAER